MIAKYLGIQKYISELCKSADTHVSQTQDIDKETSFFSFPYDRGPSELRPVSLNQQMAEELFTRCGLSPQAVMAFLDIRAIVVCNRTTYDKSNQLSTFGG